MEGFLEFLANNYVWFLTVAILLVFALIGYLVDNKTTKEDKIEEKQKPIMETGVQTIQNKSLNEVIQSNVETSLEVKEENTPLETQGLGDAVLKTSTGNSNASTVSETLSVKEK